MVFFNLEGETHNL